MVRKSVRGILAVAVAAGFAMSGLANAAVTHGPAPVPEGKAPTKPILHPPSKVKPPPAQTVVPPGLWTPVWKPVNTPGKVYNRPNNHGGPNGPPPPPPPAPVLVDALNISITTGGDDVRQNSVVIVYAEVGEDNTVYSVNMNNGANWPNGSTNTGTLQLPPGTKLSDIRQIGVHFSTHNGFGQTDDNWNMETIQVTYGNNGAVLVNQTDDPLWRFYGGNEQDWITNLP